MRAGFTFVALALLSLASCAGPQTSASVPLGLLASAIEVEWPAGCEPLNWRARPADDLLPAPPGAPGSLRRLRLGEAFTRDERIAYLAPAGSRYRVTLEVPLAAELRTSIGRVSQGEGGGALRMSATVQSGSAATPVFERELPFGAAETWSEVVIDLATWAGKEIVLELVAAGADPPETCSDRMGGWAIPHVAPREKAAAKGPNLIWISVDTLRADRLGSYGGGARTSPELDRFAADAVRFEWAISQAPWTKPSHRSMLTGLYPMSRDGLEAPFLGSVLHQAGYRTFALTGAGQVDSSFGFDRGFETYRLDDWIHDPESMLSWVLERSSDAPFFLFLHTYEAHEPYTHADFARGMPSGRLDGEYSKKIHNQLRGHLSQTEQEYVRALYDGDIAYTDGKLGLFLRDLERRGLLDSSILVLTSDHGEQLWDHGTWGHGQSLHDHQIHVPLIVHLPANLGLRTPRVESEQVELIDLYPTVLDLAGVPLEYPVQGRSLRPLFEGKGPLPPRQAFAESTNIKAFEKWALRTPRYKFVLWEPRKMRRRGGRERFELYDLRADPREQVDLSERFPEQVAKLRAEIERRIANADAERDEELPANLDAELRKQLEALGYIGN